MGDMTLEYINKHYGDVTAVNDMDLDIDDEGSVCLVGPSGCGKSTTMEIIAELTVPPEGKMFIGDREVTNLPLKGHGVAMVFQNIALFPHMDVYDNVSFELRLRNYDKEEIGRYVKRAVEIIQLQGMLGHMPDEMSGGQRQRAATACAIVQDLGVFLMDGPPADLGTKLRVHMRTEFQRLRKELDVTIIYVTHGQVEAMTMFDRIAVIDSGQLQQIDPLLVCYNEPANLFVAGFIGSLSMNFLDGEVAADGFSSTNIDVEFDPAGLGIEPGTDATMDIRPEDVYLTDGESLVSDPSHRINAMIDVLEPMGDEIFVYLKPSEPAKTGLEGTSDVANDQLPMSVAPNTDATEGEDVAVVLDRSRVHLFDTATGEAVSHDIETPVRTSGAPGTEAESNN